MPRVAVHGQVGLRLARAIKKNMKQRTKWRHRSSQPATVKKTPAQKKVLREERQSRQASMKEALTAAHKLIAELATSLHNQFPHRSKEWWIGELYQTLRRNAKKRKSGGWNVFVSQEMKRINAGIPCIVSSRFNMNIDIIVELAASGQPLKKSNKLSTELGARWKILSDNETTRSRSMLTRRRPH